MKKSERIVRMKMFKVKEKRRKLGKIEIMIGELESMDGEIEEKIM